MEKTRQTQLRRHWMAAGVTFIDPDTVYIDEEVTIGQDTIIGPNTHLKGKTTIGERCHIEGSAYIPDSRIGNDVHLRFSVVLNESELGDHTDVGPFAHLRGGAVLASVGLWGGGRMEKTLLRPFARVCGSGDLAETFAQASEIPFTSLPDDANACPDKDDNTLLVWDGLRQAFLRGDLQAWRDELQQFELRCAAPLLGALRAGRITQIILDAPGEAAYRFTLDRNAGMEILAPPQAVVSACIEVKFAFQSQRRPLPG